MCTKDFRSTKAITLIALVVSIVVLLILAGVSIVTLTGDNGLLNRTTSAKQKTELATFKEKLNLAYMSAYTDNAQNGTYTVSMEDLLGKLIIDYPEYDDDEKIVEGEQGSISSIKAKWGDTEINATNGVLIAKQGTEEIDIVPVGTPGEGLTKYVKLDGKYYEIILNENGVILGEAQDSVQISTVAVEIKEKTGLDSVTATLGNNKKIMLQAGNTIDTGTIKIGYGVHEVTVKVDIKEGYIITAVPDDTNKGTVTITPSKADNKYAEGSTISIEATARSGYAFEKWSDNIITNPREIIVGSTTAVTYTATFEEVPEFGEAELTDYYGLEVSTARQKTGEAVATPVSITYGDNQTISGKWQLFYADSNNIFLIYSDYYPNAALQNKGTANATGETIENGNGNYTLKSTNGRKSLIDYLNAKDNWTNISNAFNNKFDLTGTTTITTKGSPTVDMFVASWNNNTNQYMIPNPKLNGASGYKKLYAPKKTTAYSDGLRGHYIYAEGDTDTTTYYRDTSKLTPTAYPGSGKTGNMYFPYTSAQDSSNCYGFWLARPFSLHFL